MYPILISVMMGYLLGSIPFGYILVRTFRGTDVRTTGSGNIGATNVARTAPLLGLATLVLDFSKGLAAVVTVSALFPGHLSLRFAAAFAAIAGHVAPVWLRCKGGKGVATGLGSLVLLTPKSILVGIIVFVGVMILFRRVALASISATVSLSFSVLVLQESDNSIQFWLLVSSCVLIIAKHHQNIRRLLAGTEPRFQMARK